MAEEKIQNKFAKIFRKMQILVGIQLVKIFAKNHISFAESVCISFY